MNNIFEYHKQIKNGTAAASEWIIRLYDYLVEGIKNKDFVFDEDKADAAVEWIETRCFHTEGALAPSNLKLELWQKAIISSLFGIMEKDGSKRQFREVLLVVARKNGKSLLAAAIAKYMLYECGGYGAKIYCTAPKLDQSDIIYDNTWLMITLDPIWQEEEEEIKASIVGHNRKSIDDSGHARKRVKDIYIPANNCSFKKVAFSDRKNDGFNPSLVICDEVASWQGEKGLKQYEVWKSACGAREIGNNPSIILSCTTSGYINDSIYDELIKRSTRFLKGDSKETKLLPFLYMIDDIEKWNDIEELKKSNPNLGVSVSEQYLVEEIAIAEGSLSKKAEFITKYCNLKQNSSLAWLDTKTVDSCCGDPLSLEDFRSCYCVAGIDLSQTTDLTAATIVIEKNGELYVFAHFWLPSEKIDDATARDGLPYQMYIARGLLSVSGENFVDYRDCYNWLVGMVEKYEILPLKVGYDRYSAQYLIQDLEAYGFQTDDIFQGDNLWIVLQEMEGLMKDGKVHIGDNDLLKIHLLNSAIKMNNERGRGRLVKINPAMHIDGTAALADAFCVRLKWYNEIGGQLAND